MKKWSFRIIWLLISLGLAGLASYFMVNGFLTSKDATSFFVSFCFFFALLPLLFLIYLIIMSFSKGTYFLPDLYFENDGTFNKFPFIAFGILALATGFAFIYFGLALLGINPFVPALTSIQLELVVATAGLFFDVFLFSFIFGLIYHDDGSTKGLL